MTPRRRRRATRLGAFALDVAFESAGRRDRALRPLRRGQDHAGQPDRRAAAARRGPDRRRRRASWSTPRRGVFVPAHRRRIGYVFQDGRLFPHLTVRQNLLYGRWFAPRARTLGRRSAAIVELLGIGHLLDRRPARLSGGEKQRVAIGRALLASPRLLLMDEPLASLDEARKAEILPYIERLRDEVRHPDRLCQPLDRRGGAARHRHRRARRRPGRRERPGRRGARRASTSPRRTSATRPRR